MNRLFVFAGMLLILSAQSALAGGGPCTPAEQARGKVTICHHPPGNPENVQVLCVSVAAIPAHCGPLGHDDASECGLCPSCPNQNGVCEPELGENCVTCPQDCNQGTVCCAENDLHCVAAACCEACPDGSTCSDTTVCTEHAATDPECGGGTSNLACSTCDAPE